MAVTTQHRNIRKLNLNGVRWREALLPAALRPLQHLSSLSLASPGLVYTDLHVLSELLALRRLNLSLEGGDVVRTAASV